MSKLTPRERALLPAALVELAERDPGKWLIAAKDHARQLSSNPRQLPPLWRQAWNLTRALSRHLRAGRPKTPAAIQADRLAICQACPRFQVDTNRCSSCGCNLRLKTAWELETCPEGRW